MMYDVFNPLPYDNILDKTRLKAFAEHKLLVAVMMIFLCDRVMNTVGKGENAGDQCFQNLPNAVTSISSLSWNVFKRHSSSGSWKLGIVM